MKHTVEDLLGYLRKNSYLEEGSNFTEDDIDSLLNGAPEDVDYAHGASKMVLIPDEDIGFVLKIPFNGRYDIAYDEDDEPMDDYEFFGFEGARFTSDGWNYCETEAIIYEMAKEAGIETCFAKTEYVGDIDGYPVYSQERAEIFYCRKNESEYSEETRSKTRDKCKELNVESSINICWMTDFLAYYGEEMLKTFMTFIFDNRIGDLHSDNIGYIGNRPVLIDYSGFCS